MTETELATTQFLMKIYRSMSQSVILTTQRNTNCFGFPQPGNV